MNKDPHERDLFLYDSHWGKRLLNLEPASNAPLLQKLIANNELTCHFDLIYFCGAVQALGLDFLPMYWQPRRGLIGSGATRQSLVGIELSLAFKAINLGDVSRIRTPQGVKSMYELLLAEIQLMGRLSILDSPYIRRVEGVCWNLNVKTGVADPVLVYKKANHDMYHFMTSGQENSLGFLDKVRMCRDVATGLMKLHACNIIHGDVKPENVLLMDSEDGFIIPQVANFGYSTIYANSNIGPARTGPWHAPEFGILRQEYTHLDAIRTDIFSFGMLSLWVLFREEVAEQFGIMSDFADVCEPTESEPDSLFEITTKLKNEDRLRPFCQNVVQSLNLKTSQQKNLAELFNLSLSPHPKDRTSDLQALWFCLNGCLNPQSGDQAASIIDSAPASAMERQHFEFKISKSIMQLIQSDIRVRQYIVQALLDQAQYATCPKCRSNAAFQASICLAIGFGIAASNDLALEWLQKSGRSHAALDLELCGISQRCQIFETSLYRSDFLQDLHNDGYFQNIDNYDVYTADHALETIKQSYEREVSDVATKLGSETTVSLALSNAYAALLSKVDQHADPSSNTQERCLKYLQANPKYETPLLPRSDLRVIELAESYRLRGMFEIASRWCDVVLHNRTETLGHDHILTLEYLYFEAAVMREMGYDREAEKLFEGLLPRLQPYV